jgi:hypothetical protein
MGNWGGGTRGTEARSIVILSAAKDPYECSGEILRFAQNDTRCLPSFPASLHLHITAGRPYA